MAAPMGARLSRAALPGAVLLAAALGLLFSRGAGRTGRYAAGAEDPAPEAAEEADPLGANAACYVCHVTFVKEELSKVHLEGKITCIVCHGLSAAHANDEYVGATPPDVGFTRDQVEPLCLRCHVTHDAPARKVLTRFLKRGLSTKSPPACVDCHGSHKIEPPTED
jgi:hypothetical protein